MTTPTEEMVERFLTWPVPADVHPDGTPGQPGRTGTNLLTAAQAEEMLAHVLSPPIGGGSVEEEIRTKGLTAARVTPADLEAAIASEWYINAGTGVVPDDFQPPVPAASPLNLLTLCVLVCRNGFTVVGKSACASPQNFDAALGRRIAREDAVRQLWPLMGYALRERLAAAQGGASA